MHRRESAFTLIEILVVMAIIALLMAILFPVFARAREKARQVQCLSNLKNCAQAVRLYVQDHELLPSGFGSWQTQPQSPCTMTSAVPGWCNGGLNPSAQLANSYCAAEVFCGWAFNIQPYFKNRQSLLCPHWNRVPFIATSVAPPSYRAENHQVTTYHLSAALLRAPESEINKPANKVMLFEVLPFHWDRAFQASASYLLDSFIAKPNQTVVIAFADGHVKTVNMNYAWGKTAAGSCSPVNGWSLHTGWSSPNVIDCNAGGPDRSPAGQTGRGGGNF